MLAILKQLWLNLTTIHRAISLWYPSADVDAQCAHMTTAIAIVLITVVLHHSLVLGCILALIWAIIKEFIFDFAVEADSWFNSILDFSFYIIGIIVACILVIYV